MIDLSCPICQARYESLTRAHDKRLAALRHDYELQLVSLRKIHAEKVAFQAKWRAEQLEIIRRLHAEHAGGVDGS